MPPTLQVDWTISIGSVIQAVTFVITLVTISFRAARKIGEYQSEVKNQIVEVRTTMQTSIREAVHALDLRMVVVESKVNDMWHRDRDRDREYERDRRRLEES